MPINFIYRSNFEDIQVLVIEHRFVSVCSCLTDLHQWEDHINSDIEGGFCLLGRRFNCILINLVVASISKQNNIKFDLLVCNAPLREFVIDHFDRKRRRPPISRDLSTDFFSQDKRKISSLSAHDCQQTQAHTVLAISKSITSFRQCTDDNKTFHNIMVYWRCFNLLVPQHSSPVYSN